MGFMQSYSKLLLQHPKRILLIGSWSVVSLFLLTLLLRPIPSFKDPLVGFEVRDTEIAARLNTWKLLMEETSLSYANPSTTIKQHKYDQSEKSTMSSTNNEPNPLPENIYDSTQEPPQVEMSLQETPGNSSSSSSDMMDEDEEEYYRSINSTADTSSNLMHYSLGSSKAFCGKIYDGYAQFVISPANKHQNSNLYTLNSILSICQLDRRLRLEHSPSDSHIFQRDCEQYLLNERGTKHSQSACCNSWSLPNYIACLSNKTTCTEITNIDIKNFEHLLDLCAPHYYRVPYEECFVDVIPQEAQKDEPANLETSIPSSSSQPHSKVWSYCGKIPEKCLRCNGWTYSVLHYLVNDNFVRIKSKNSTNIKFNSVRTDTFKTSNYRMKEIRVDKLSLTNIFLPIAKSSSLMKYYKTLSKFLLKNPFTQVKAMDLGMKNSLFEHLISDDVKLFIVALVSILFVISIYTWSFILSVVILIIICLSLCMSFTIYELILNIPIFPFMNLLAVVISFGICSDNAMLFCKHWNTEDEADGNDLAVSSDNSNYIGKNHSKERINLDRTLRKAIISTMIATLATACSFIISALSKIAAVRCFCIFATLSVLTNYLLIVILLPPALIVDSRFKSVSALYFKDKGKRLTQIGELIQGIRKMLLSLDLLIHRKWIFISVTKFKFYLIIGFTTLLLCSSVIVFHKPTLRAADNEDIQLLSRHHAFEQYDRRLRKQFAFERAKMSEFGFTSHLNTQLQDAPETLPVRIVFGVNPVDNGDHFDSDNRGSLVYDTKFDPIDPKAQIWLLDFCQKLRQQRFIHPSNLPDLSNCYIDTFKSWLDTRPCIDPVTKYLDRRPCCQDVEFPYSRNIINRCMGEAITIMRKTPQFNTNLNAGLRFKKNSTKIVALILEYPSSRLFTESFTKMDRFYTDLDDWVTWHINNTAPQSLKTGWFISSNLELLALQTELQQSTMSSILIEVSFAMFALLVSTRDVFITIAGTLTIGTIIIVTVASLILFRWTLGVTESILISLTIGLSIDFALHYSVAFSESRRTGSSHSVIYGILNQVGSPIALASVTTSLAGFVIIWSDILAYQELGVFLMLIAFVSWTTSTFFLLPMLATIGLVADFADTFAKLIIQRVCNIFISC